MQLLDEFEDSKFIKEVSTIAGGSTAVDTFTGGAGDTIDTKFAGPFHSNFGDLRKTLEKQVEGDIAKRMYTDDNTPLADQDFIDLEWDYEYTSVLDIDKSKFKSNSDEDMEFIDIEINYDKIIDNSEENEKFINDSNDWKSIYDAKKY